MKPNLTPRQLEVHRLIQQGMRNEEIAGQLGISVVTVKTYKDRFRVGVVGQPLTRRQMEVGGLLRMGLNNAEIGLRLGISPRSVEAYRQRLSHKLGARNSAHLSTLLSEAESAEAKARTW